MGINLNGFFMKIKLPKECGKNKERLKTIAGGEVASSLHRLGNNRSLQGFANVKFMDIPCFTHNIPECKEFLRYKQLKSVLHEQDVTCYLGENNEENAISIEVAVYFPGEIDDFKCLQKIYRKMSKDIRNYFVGPIYSENMTKPGAKATMIFKYGDEDCKKKRLL